MPHATHRIAAEIGTAVLALTLLGCNPPPVATSAQPSAQQNAQLNRAPEQRSYPQRSAEDNDDSEPRRRHSHRSRSISNYSASGQYDSNQSDANTTSAAPSAYDYYILNLSWSPEFCHSHPDNEQCSAHPGFVVHGLWPERNDGSYPEDCPQRPGPTSDAAWQGVIPTAYLAQHEWQTHGTCTPYAPDAYFGLIRKAYQSIKIPSALTHTTHQTMQSPSDIIDSFARINTGLPSGSIVLSCGNNYLTAIEVCFDKNLHPRACGGLRTCHANAVKITPQIDSQTDATQQPQ